MDNFLQTENDIPPHVTDKEFLDFKAHFQYQKYRKGDFIIKENDSVENIYFIFSGLVKLSYVDNEAKEYILSFAFENWWETDFSAFYNQTKATLALQCLEDSEIYSLPYETYLNALQTHQLSNYFLDKSIKGHLSNQRRILSLLTLSPRARYEQFLQLYPSIKDRVPKSVLARYLGLSRETLSRLYKSTKK